LQHGAELQGSQQLVSQQGSQQPMRRLHMRARLHFSVGQQWHGQHSTQQGWQQVGLQQGCGQGAGQDGWQHSTCTGTLRQTVTGTSLQTWTATFLHTVVGTHSSTV
jgi:hypothetical protein